MNYKLIIAYDGTGYLGWAKQPNKNTIADTLHNAFTHAFGREPYLIGASRTDAGVHALGQAVLLKTDLKLPPQEIMRVWNNALPESIVIRSLEHDDGSFHPYHNVTSKTYWYHVFPQRPLPFVSRYGWYYQWPIDLEKLKHCLRVFEGTHDFRSFSRGWERDNTVRTIDAISVRYLKRFGVYRIEVVGQKFLQHMIRRIVGACVKVAATPELSCDTLREALAQKDPQQQLPNAPAKGLVLQKIVYEENI